MLLFVYLFWSHRTTLLKDDDSAEQYQSDNTYRTEVGEKLYLENINLKQIDERKTNNRQDDQKDLGKDFERQHLFSASTNSDRSSSKLDFNSQKHESKILKQTTTLPPSAATLLLSDREKIGEHINEEIKNEKIQNNDHASRTSSVSSIDLLPARLSKATLNPLLKQDYSLLRPKATTNPLASKSNQSPSISTIFPVERRKNSKSILEKQIAWYELIGITMFNLLGSSLAGQNSKVILNKKFKNHSTASAMKIQSNVETTLSRPISFSIHSNSTSPNDTSTNSQQANSNQTLSLIKNLKRRLPQCIIIGVRKAGTRAVLEYLSLNDHIRKADQEVHFFDNDERYALGLDYYRNQMPLSAQGQITIGK